MPASYDSGLPPIAPARRTAPWMAGFGFVASLVVGAALGVVLDRLVLLPPWAHQGLSVHREMPDRRDPAVRRQMADRFAKEIGLTPQQRVAVDSIVNRQVERARTARESIRPVMDSIVQETQRQIDSLLTPDQKVKFAQFRARMQAEHARQHPDTTHKPVPLP